MENEEKMDEIFNFGLILRQYLFEEFKDNYLEDMYKIQQTLYKKGVIKLNNKLKELGMLNANSAAAIRLMVGIEVCRCFQVCSLNTPLNAVGHVSEITDSKEVLDDLYEKVKIDIFQNMASLIEAVTIDDILKKNYEQESKNETKH